MNIPIRTYRILYRFRAEAGIVNYYQLGATLSGHTDHSEDDLTAPLISIRSVCDSVFGCVYVHIS